MPEPNFSGLLDEVRAAYKPHFAEVTRRAARRRVRFRTAGVAAVAVVALGAAAGLTTAAGHGHAPATPGRPSPSDTSVSIGGGPMFTAGDLNHLYITNLAHSSCTEPDCEYVLAASADQGATWRRSPIPIPPGRMMMSGVVPLSPTTLLAPYEAPPNVDPHAPHTGGGYLASSDAGRTWHPVDVRTVDAIPSGWQTLDSFEPTDDPWPQAVVVLAADPATGQVVRLAPDPPVYAGGADGRLPASAGLWITGLRLSPDSPTRPPTRAPDHVIPDKARGTGTVSVSHDGGRTWDTHAFTGTDTEYQGLPVTPLFATDNGRTAYAVLPRNGAEVVYRTTDGGVSWAAGGTVDTEGGNTGGGNTSVSRLTMRADGTVVALLSGDGSVEYASTDGGRSFHRLTEDHPSAESIPGGYADLVQETAEGPDASGQSNQVVWLSPDHKHWTRVPLPTR